MRNRKQTSRPTEGPRVIPGSAAPTDSLVPDEQIRERAHQIFLARGGVPGNELDDWLRAEQELKRERTQAKRPREDL